jgi:predicted oxidoreductase
VRVSRLRARKAALAGGVALLLTGGLFFAMSRPATKDPARVAAALDLARQVWEPRAAAEGPHDP